MKFVECISLLLAKRTVKTNEKGDVSNCLKTVNIK